MAGWAAVADALERVTSLTSLNGCGHYAAIRAGGLRELELDGTELGVWAARFLERSGSTLTRLHVQWVIRRPHRAMPEVGVGHRREVGQVKWAVRVCLCEREREREGWNRAMRFRVASSGVWRP